MSPKSKLYDRPQVIPNHRYLQFDVFDALGLDPSPTLSRRDINKAYQRAVLIVHPDRPPRREQTFVPTFPTVQQAQDARDSLLGADHRVCRAHGLLWRNHRSTWNPSAARGTAAILQPRTSVMFVPDTDAIPNFPGSPRHRGNPPPPSPPPPRRRAKAPRTGHNASGRNHRGGGARVPRQNTRHPPQPSQDRARRWAHHWAHATPNQAFVGDIQNNGRQFAVEGGFDSAGRLTLRRRDVDVQGNQNPPYVGPQSSVVARNSSNLTWLIAFAGFSDNPAALKTLIQQLLNFAKLVIGLILMSKTVSFRGVLQSHHGGPQECRTFCGIVCLWSLPVVHTIRHSMSVNVLQTCVKATERSRPAIYGGPMCVNKPLFTSFHHLTVVLSFLHRTCPSVSFVLQHFHT